MTRLDWFESKIGQTLFRPKTNCNCVHCEFTYHMGLEVKDDSHAFFLWSFEEQMMVEGENYKYFDNKQEMLDYEKTFYRN